MTSVSTRQRPIAGANVWLYRLQANRSWRSISWNSTGSDGSFWFKQMPPGVYTLGLGYPDSQAPFWYLGGASSPEKAAVVEIVAGGTDLSGVHGVLPSRKKLRRRRPPVLARPLVHVSTGQVSSKSCPRKTRG